MYVLSFFFNQFTYLYLSSIYHIHSQVNRWWVVRYWSTEIISIPIQTLCTDHCERSFIHSIIIVSSLKGEVKPGGERLWSVCEALPGRHVRFWRGRSIAAGASRCLASWSVSYRSQQGFEHSNCETTEARGNHQVFSPNSAKMWHFILKDLETCDELSFVWCVFFSFNK